MQDVPAGKHDSKDFRDLNYSYTNLNSFCVIIMIYSCFAAKLTSSNHSFNANIGCIDLFGEVPDSLVGVFVGVRMDVGPAARELDWVSVKVEKSGRMNIRR